MSRHLQLFLTKHFQVDISLEIYEIFQTTIHRTKKNMLIAILLSFFVTYWALLYSSQELPC